ncbi:MAG TPA: methyltransferase domain-containing protein [Anaerolineales bacterium]|nr:methyltransferase domain-containing protein [Anaerolineales bacterium]
MPTHRASIRKYYDQNTRLFLAFNRSRQTNSIHRALWTDGAKTLNDALNVIHERIRVEIETAAPSHARIADLGCGVGATLLYLIPRLQEPKLAFGLTISPVQARLAKRYAKEAGLDGKILFIEGDFTFVPLQHESLDIIFSVEAAAHAQDPERYMEESSRLLRRGGRLILVDDYLADRPLTSSETTWLKAFISGWHVPGIRTVEQIRRLAGKYQLRWMKNDNLTPFLHLRPLSRFIADTLLFLGKRLPLNHAILPSLIGSIALQQCLFMNVIEYRFLIFIKL